MQKSRPLVNEVFTPRSATVNASMYIDRPANQRELIRAVQGCLHIIMFGESGSGKSWLYRHVASVENWRIFHVNAANASRSNSIAETVASAILPEMEMELVEYNTKIAAEAKPLGVGGASEAQRKYKITPKEILLRSFEAARKDSGEKTTVLVIDNLEAIFNKPSLMEELGNILLLLDDPDYAKFNIKILLVGLPYEIVEYYQRIENLETVANRIQELPAVTALNWGQIEEFIHRGFNEQLKLKLSIEQIREISEHVRKTTLGIAQRMHEYCEILGFCIEDSESKYDSSLLKIADNKFLIKCLRKAHAVVDSFMNERKTKTGRRNQVIFALGKIDATEFYVNQVEDIVRILFPESTKDTKLAVGQTLSDLAKGRAPLLRRISKGANYRFSDSRYLMCIRVLLRKSKEGERVLKATFSR